MEAAPPPLVRPTHLERADPSASPHRRASSPALFRGSSQPPVLPPSAPATRPARAADVAHPDHRGGPAVSTSTDRVLTALLLIAGGLAVAMAVRPHWLTGQQTAAATGGAVLLSAPDER